MTAGRARSLLLFLVVGALIGFALPSYRASGVVRYLSNFHAPYDPPEGRTRWTSMAQAAVAIPDTGCRPTRLRLRVRSPAEAGEGLQFAVAGGAPAALRAGPAWAWHDVTIEEPASRGGYLRLVLTTATIDLAGGPRLGVGVNAFDVAPPDATCRIASTVRHAAMGVLLWAATSVTLLGGVLRVLTGWRRRAHVVPQVGDVPGRAEGSRGVATGAAITIVVLAVVFAVWASMKPPTQSPDEVDHVVRAAALVRHPWVAVDDRFCVPGALANPLVFPTAPDALARLYFRADRTLSHDAVAGLRTLRFPDTEGCAQSHASSYPPLYYAAVLAGGAIGHPVLGLSPWDTFLTMRLASAVVGAAAWLPLLLLVRGLLPGERGLLAVLPLALAPMTGFITGAVNPDAVHIPLALGAGVAWFRMLREGGHRVAAHALLLGALLTKPPGVTLLLALLIVVPVGLWRGWWTRERATAAWRELLFTGAAAYATYYVWSPPAPPGPTPVGLTFADGLEVVLERMTVMWPAFWGIFGYLDYGMPRLWSSALVIPLIPGAIAMIRRPAAVPTFTWYAVLLLGVYAALLFAVQLLLVSSIGAVLQGRYFLPAGLAVPLIALAGGRRAAWSLLLLVAAGVPWAWHLSVMRYYADGWAGWVQALPFVR